MKHLILEYPHPYLIWKGKQTRIAHPDELPQGEKLGLICNEELYGYVTLGQPAQSSGKYLNQSLKEHCLREADRQLWYPDAKAFYIYPFEFESLKKFKKVKIIGDSFEEQDIGRLTKKEKFVIDKIEDLPKYVVLEKDAIFIGPHNDRLTISPAINPELISPILSAHYDKDFEVGTELLGSHVPLYALGLIRIPNPSIHYKKVSRKDAPGYKKAKENLCPTCRYAKEGRCSLYEFKHGENSTCKSYEIPDKKDIDVIDLGQVTFMNKTYVIANKELNEVVLYDIVDNHEDCDQRFAVVMAETGEMIDCHDTVDAAEQQILALAVSVDEEPTVENPGQVENEDEVQPMTDKPQDLPETEEEEVSEEKKGLLKDIYKFQDAFHSQYSQLSGSNEIWYMNVIDIYDDYIVAEIEDGPSYSGYYSVAWDGPFDNPVFAERETWVELEQFYLPVMKSFDETEWDGSESNWPDAKTYCADCLIDLNPSGKEKTKELGKLPYRKYNTSIPNKNAIEAIVGDKGILALEKPENVTQEEWDSAVSKAASRVIVWYKNAFDKPAPEAVYLAAGKTPPQKSMLDFFGSWVKGLFGKKVEMKNVLENNENLAFKIFEVNGEPWFFTWGASAFKDREQEIFTTKALENYVEENATNPQKGWFNVFHIAGTDFAKKEFQAVIGRILVEAGPFLDDKKGQAALEFFKNYPERHPELAPEGFGASVEYRYLPEELMTGTYNWLWVTRTSVLPKADAANLITKGSMVMALSDKQRAFGEELFGKETFNNIVSEAEEKSQKLENDGVEFKSVEQEGEKENAEVVDGESVNDIQSEETVTATEEPVIEESNTDKTETTETQTEEKEDEGQNDGDGLPNDEAVQETELVIQENLIKSVVEQLVDVLQLEDRFGNIESAIESLQKQIKENMVEQQVKDVSFAPKSAAFFGQKSAQRASEAEQTEVDDQEFKNRKPKATNPKSGADSFFNS